MDSWNSTTHSLPESRECVQFIVTARREWLFGTFENDCFRSRWAAYNAADVSLWRKLDGGLDRAPQHPVPDRVYWSERRMREA